MIESPLLLNFYSRFLMESLKVKISGGAVLKTLKGWRGDKLLLWEWEFENKNKNHSVIIMKIKYVNKNHKIMLIYAKILITVSADIKWYYFFDFKH